MSEKKNGLISVSELEKNQSLLNSYYKQTFSGSYGQAILNDLKEKINFEREGKLFDKENSSLTAYRLGQLDMILYILQRVNTNN